MKFYWYCTRGESSFRQQGEGTKNIIIHILYDRPLIADILGGSLKYKELSFKYILTLYS